MKRIIYLLSIVIVATMISCEEDETGTPDNGNSLISKMIVDGTYGYTTTFEYNEDNLLIKVKYTNYYHLIEYDSQNRPIKITEIEYERPDYLENYFTITYETNSFTKTQSGYENLPNKYTFDSQERISKIDNLYDDGDGIFDITYSVEYTYQNNESVHIEMIDDGMVDKTIDINFGTINSPFKGIDNIVIIAADLFYVEELIYSSNYAIQSYSSNSSNTTITYEVNDNNYPISASVGDYEFITFEY